MIVLVRPGSHRRRRRSGSRRRRRPDRGLVTDGDSSAVVRYAISASLFRQLGPEKCAQRPDEPLLVLLSCPAAVDGQDAMDIGRQGDIRDVDRLGEFQLGVKGAAGGQGGDDPGLASAALPPDLLHELSRIGVDLGGGCHDVHDPRRPRHEGTADSGERPDQRHRVRFVPRCLDLGPLAEGDGLVVTAEGDIKNGLEQRPLGGEQAVQGGQRGVGGAGDRFEGGGGIAGSMNRALAASMVRSRVARTWAWRRVLS